MGADVNQAMENGATFLFIATKNGHLEMVKCLIDEKSDVNLAMKNGATSILTASANGHIDVIEILIENKAEVNYHDKDSSTRLYVVSQEGHLKVVTFLIEKRDLNKADEYVWTLGQLTQRYHVYYIDTYLISK
jgi:serine/threonine-protein phosphatase 6 regulatory ankyrin repeat subunit B